MKQREAVPVTKNGYMSCGYYFYPASFSYVFNILRCKLIKEIFYAPDAPRADADISGALYYSQYA